MILKIVLGLFVLYATANWIVWKLNFQAVLLYCMESGINNIDAHKIKEYREKVIKKHFKVS